MPRYHLNALGDTEFESMVQALLKAVIGSGTITFGAGRDGAREATYEGSAPYPSSSNQWSGKWIFQVKFHDIDLIGVQKARAKIISDVEDELKKITRKYKYNCDNYILITNVPLSGVHDTGTIDKIKETVFPKYTSKIRHLAIWGADDVNRLLDKHPEVRTSYLSLLVSGDIIAQLLKLVETPQSERTITIDSYLRTVIRREENAQLDQAGDVGEDPIVLQKVFFDLDAYIQYLTKPAFSRLRGEMPIENLPVAEDDRVPLVWLLVNSSLDRVVIVGGPGEGKSTLGQYLAQIHRATLLGKAEEVAISEDYIPDTPRLPFRVALRDFAQWLAGHSSSAAEPDTLDTYISSLIARASSRQFTERDLHEVLRSNPALLVLDGLDEVTDAGIRKRLLARLSEFIERTQDSLHADMQVIATTRPTGYSDQFDPKTFIHFTLRKLRAEQVNNYVEKWASARDLDEAKGQRLQFTIQECLDDHQISLLMTTPLQVTILILIINSGGTPPRQREALFNEYLEVIYKREKAKGLGIIKSEKELLIGLHEYIGYLLQEKSTRASESSAILPRSDYDNVVMNYLRHHDPFSPKDEISAEWKAITVDAGERLVLIVESPANVFGFELRSIQEFFAACYLTDTASDTQQRYRRFDAIARTPHWRNVALFFAGRVGRNSPGEASNVVEVCRDVDRSGVDNYVRRGAELALELAADRALEPNRVLQRSLLEHGLSVFDSKLSSRSRSSFMDLVRRLPFEDIRDHVLPILYDRLTVVGRSGRQNICHLLAVIQPSSPELRDVLLQIASEPGSLDPTEILSMISSTELPGTLRIEVVKALLQRGVDPVAIAKYIVGISWDMQCAFAFSLIGSEICDVMEAPFAEAVARGMNYGTTREDDLDFGKLPKHPLSLVIRTARALSQIFMRHFYTPDMLYRIRMASEISAGRLPEEVNFGTFDYKDPSQGATWFLWLAHFTIGRVTSDSWIRYCDWRQSGNMEKEQSNIWRYAGDVATPIIDVLATSNSRDLPRLRESALMFAGLSGIHVWLDRVRKVGDILDDTLSSSEIAILYHFGPGALAEERRQVAQEILDDLFPVDLQPGALDALLQSSSQIQSQADIVTSADTIARASNWFASLEDGSPWKRPRLASLIASSLPTSPSLSLVHIDEFLPILPAYVLGGLAVRFCIMRPLETTVLHRILKEIAAKRSSGEQMNAVYMRYAAADPRNTILGFLRFYRDDDSKIGDVVCSIIVFLCRNASEEHSRPVPIRSQELDRAQTELVNSQSEVQRAAGISLYSVRPPRSATDWMRIDSLLQTASIQEISALWAWIIPAAAELSNQPEQWIQHVGSFLEGGVHEQVSVVMSDVLRGLLQKQSQSLDLQAPSLGLSEIS